MANNPKQMDYISESRRDIFCCELLEKYNSIKCFCDATLEDYSSIFKYYHGQLTIGNRVARKLESLLLLPSGYLDKNIPTQLTVNIPIAPLQQLHNPEFNPEQLDTPDYIVIPRKIAELISNDDINKLVAFAAPDNSLAPTINENCLSIIDYSQTAIITNKIYALFVYDEFYVRRLSKSFVTGNLILSTDKTIESIELTHKNYQIIGRIVYTENIL